MFKIPQPNLIESDEGFSVEVLGWTGLIYKEGPKQMRIDSEVLASPGGIMIIRSSIRKWEPPYDNESLDENQCDAILENIRRTFRFTGEWINHK